WHVCFFFQAEDGIRDRNVTGVQTCALPISLAQEWVDHIEPYRSVEVILNGKNKSIKVRLESGERVLRSIYLKDVRKVWIECNHRSEERRVGKERGSETGSGR